MDILEQVKSAFVLTVVATSLAACGGGSSDTDAIESAAAALGDEIFTIPKEDNPESTPENDNESKTQDGSTVSNASTDPDLSTDSDLNIEPEATTQVFAFTPTEGPNTNPLKGWNSSWWKSFEESSVGFQYLEWGQFEPSDDVFDHAYVERTIDRPGSTGRHVILRLYCDWDGLSNENKGFDASERGKGCPFWLYDPEGDYKVARIPYVGKYGQNRYVTDFNSEVFLDQATQAINALADYLKNDPRVFVLQLGVIGYWGEWHTTYADDDLNLGLTQATQARVLNDWLAATENTDLLLAGRYPWNSVLSEATSIGYHNDFFVPDHIHNDEFDTEVGANEFWLNGPIGGEVPPRSESRVSLERELLYGSGPDDALGDQMIETARYSTMAPGVYRPTMLDAFDEEVEDENGNKKLDELDQHYDDYLRLHRKMGYNFHIASAELPVSVPLGASSFDVSMNLQNIGVAPMYKDWELQFGLIDSQDNLHQVHAVEFDTRSLLPDQTAVLQTQFSSDLLHRSDYRVAVRLIQPGADAVKPEPWKLNARNTYIQFASAELTVLEGVWNPTDHNLEGGWSILGSISIVD